MIGGWKLDVVSMKPGLSRVGGCEKLNFTAICDADYRFTCANPWQKRANHGGLFRLTDISIFNVT